MTQVPVAPQGASAEEKRRLLAQLLQKKAAQPKTAPATFAQQRLWFLERLDPGNAIYDVTYNLVLHGGADVPAVEKAAALLVRRHETLRTRLAEEDGQPVQVIEPAGEWRLEVVERPFPEGETVTKAHIDELTKDFRTPYDLEKGPLFRARLYRAGAELDVLAIGMHHTIADGWSIAVFQKEFGLAYLAYQEGREPDFEPLLVQYADYAVWQRKILSGEELQRQLAFWKDQFVGAPMVIDLPSDRPRPPVQGHDGSSLEWKLGKEVLERAKELTRGEGATLFMTLLSTWALLLHRYSGQDSVVLGSPILGRPREELEKLIGYFANTLALRVDLSGDPSFRELLRRTREMLLGAYAHQDLPFEKLVDELKVERVLNCAPIYQVMFSLQDIRGDRKVEAEAKISTLGVSDAGAAAVDLVLQCNDWGEALYCKLEYSTDLYDADSIQRIADHFGVVLEAVTQDPDRRLSDYPLLTDEERGKVVETWKGEAAEYPAEPAHRLFEEQARRTPGRAALSHAGRETSYAELNARANRLARHLAKLGVGPDVPVAVSVQRSPEMVVAVLAAWKAGGAFIPVDPVYPADRRAYMLEDSGAPLLLTQRHLVSDLPPHRAQVVLLDQDFADESSDDLDVAVAPENLAYVIYTSGSTGKPKGVMVPHVGLGNLAAGQIEAFGVKPEGRVLQFASFSFDAAVSEVLMAILGGATLHLAPQEELMPGAPLLGVLKNERISVVTLPPSVLSVLDAAALPELETVVSAGEACTPEVVKKWGRGRRFVNAYGPTETSVCASLGAVDGTDARVPIGRPLVNQRVYVLDGHLQPLGVGIPGELCVGGVGVARGYLRRPGLTAERFVPDAVSGVPGARLYRTGDRARWLRDGRLEFMGRIDHQVKIRGYRIELGEIEAALREQPGVRDALVQARVEEGGDARLVAYLVTGGAEADAAALKAALGERLPEYMVPAHFVALEDFPRLPNGKVDHRALAELDTRGEGEEYVAPRTPTEEKMAEVWADVLGLDRVGVTEDFFDLGGHSLLATQVISRVREAFGVELPVRTVFEAPTVALLSLETDKALAAGTTASAASTPIGRTARRGVSLESLKG